MSYRASKRGGGPQQHAPSVNGSIDSSRPFTEYYENSEDRDNRYIQKYTQVDEHGELKPSTKSIPNHSLSHYFSTLTVTAIVILLTATVLLFIWSNTSDGAWVKLQVIPRVNITQMNLENTQNTQNTQTSYINSIISLLNNVRIELNANSHNTQTNNTNNNDFLQLFSELSVINNNNNNELVSISGISNLPQSIISGIKKIESGENVFSFSLISSIRDFWQSKAYMLACLVGFFSGIWPYIKLLLLAVCWLYPLPQKTREKILFMLDQLGKFSFIDLYVLVIMTVCFYVRINESLSFVGFGLYITVEPDVGINTFVIGTVISMLFSHYFLLLDAMYAKPQIKKKKLKIMKKIEKIKQNKAQKSQIITNSEEIINNPHKQLMPPPTMGTTIVQNEEPITEPNGSNDIFYKQDIEQNKILKNEQNESLLSMTENNNNDNNNKYDNKDVLDCEREWNHKLKPFCLRFLPKSWFGVIMRSVCLMTVFAALWLTYLSMVSSAVRFDMEGLIGLFISDPIRAFTPIEIYNQFPHKTDEKISAFWLKVTFVITVIIFPLLTIVIMIFTWFLPMTYKYCVYMSHALSVSCAWAALDVLLIAAFAASVELERVSEWILSQNFDLNGVPVCSTPKGIVYKYSGLQCFAVIGHITDGFPILLAAVLTTWFTIIYTTYEVHWAKLEYKERTKNERLIYDIQ